MQFLILGVIGLALFLGMAQLFVSADPRTLALVLRYGVGGAIIVVGGLLTFGGRVGTGLTLIAIGVGTLTRGWLGPFNLGRVGGRRSADQASSVTSAFFEMRLDHQSGAVDGRVIAGSFAGRTLDDLEEPALRDLLREVAADADSVRLLEAYLDRRKPSWREDFQKDAAVGAGSPSRASAMSQEEAYQVLGLQPGASEAEIHAAHRRLMKQVHPDQGGTTFLAAKINEAKDRLLGKHR